jgi:ribonuclease P protein component
VKSIRKNRQFKQFKENGKRYNKKFFSLVVVKSDDYNKSDFGLAVITSKKIGKAVIRNKVRRWIKGFFRNPENYVPCGFNYLVITRSGIFAYGYKKIWEDLINVIDKIRKDTS